MTTVPLCSPGWPRTGRVAQADLELATVLLPLGIQEYATTRGLKLTLDRSSHTSHSQALLQPIWQGCHVVTIYLHHINKYETFKTHALQPLES